MNQEIFYFLNNIASQYVWLDNLIIFCAQWLPFLIIGIFVGYCALRAFSFEARNTWRDEPIWKGFLRKFSIIFGSTFLIWGVSQIINHFYYSPRPFILLEDLNVLFTHGNGDSFPSGHATFFFSLAFTSYYYCHKWIFNLLLIGAVIVSFSRIISGVHWPLDILGALVLSLVGVYLIRKIIPNK
ncbi:phosphatase PAP2 family protein, partial [Patescibacteria group bacterium]|nr:phosphatase PAP2 family protein [Patescibacteria group bacterium]